MPRRDSLYAKPGRCRWTWRGQTWRWYPWDQHEHEPFHPSNYEFWYCWWCRRALCHQPHMTPEWTPYTGPGLMWKGSRYHWQPPIRYLGRRPPGGEYAPGDWMPLRRYTERWLE